MKVLLFLLVVLTAAFFVADRIAENTAEKRIEERLASSVENAEGLQVDVTGALFLPQVLSGGFDEVTVSIDSIERRGLTVDDLRVALRDVEFSLGDLLKDAGAVTVGGGKGRGSISERSLNAALPRGGVEAEIVLDQAATATVQGVSAEVEEISVDKSGTIIFDAPPLPPFGLDLPATVASIRYSGARVSNNRLVVDLRVRRGSLNL